MKIKIKKVFTEKWTEMKIKENLSLQIEDFFCVLEDLLNKDI